MGINFGTTSAVNTTTEVQTPTGISLDLHKGALLDLTKREPGLKHIITGVGWDANNAVPAFDLDISAFLLNADKKITSAADIIFFNNRSASGVTISPDNRSGSGEGDDEQITIDLDAVPANIMAIDFVVNIFEAQARRQTFGMVKNSYIRLLNSDNNNAELCRFRLKEEYGSSTAVIFARLKRDGSDWQFETLGEGKVAKDLNDIAALYM